MAGQYFFYFFQTEDGIRDIGVTGFLTCALPILRPFEQRGVGVVRLDRHVEDRVAAWQRRGIGEAAEDADDRAQAIKSEESRVGEECRSRRAANHLKR